MLRFAVIIFFAMLPVTLHAEGERKPSFTKIDESLEIDVSNFKAPEKDYLSSVFRQLNRCVSKFFPGEKKGSALPLRILFPEEAAGGMEIIPVGSRMVNIYISASTAPRLCENNLLMNRLTAALMLSKGRIPPTNRCAVPFWLSSGIKETISGKITGPSAYTFRIYPHLHNFLCAGKNITLANLLEAQDSIQEYTFNTLYAEAAEILYKELSGLKYGKKNPFLDMAILYSRTDVKDNKAAFISAFKEQILAEELKNPDRKTDAETIADSEKMENWFHSKLLKHSVNYFMPADSVMSSRIFENATRVNLPDGKTYEISELPAALKTIKDAKARDNIIADLRNSIMQAVPLLPPQCRSAAANLLDALFRFSNGTLTPDDFSKSTKKAKQAFLSELESGKKLEYWTALTEKENMEPGISIRRYSEVIENIDRIEKENRPGINRFLDDVENKFGK